MTWGGTPRAETEKVSQEKSGSLDLACELAVLGTGLVTPLGADVKETVFAYAAGTYEVSASPYLKTVDPFGDLSPSPEEDLRDEDVLRVDARCCPWLGHRLDQLNRLVLMAQSAAGEALMVRSQAGTGPFRGKLALFIIVAPPRAGFGVPEQTTLKDTLQERLGVPKSTLHHGDVALYDLFKEATKTLAEKQADGVLIVAVDTQISLHSAARQVEDPQSNWLPLRPPLGEGAGALLLVHPHQSHQKGQSFAHITGACAIGGRAKLDNDEIVNGLPLTGLLSRVREKGVHVAAYGPRASSVLSSREWDLAFARNRGVLVEGSAITSLESTMGVLGAATSTISLAYAIGAYFWGALNYDGVAEDAMAPIVVWGLGHDSRRGILTAGLKRMRSEQAAVEFASSRGRPKSHFLESSRVLEPAPESSIPVVPDLAMLVTFDLDGGHPIPKQELQEGVLFAMFDEAKMVAKHRVERHLEEGPGEDAQFFRLQDAAASYGQASPPQLQKWWRTQLEGEDSYRSFVLAYTWSAWSQDDAMSMLQNDLALLPEVAREDAVLAGQALALSPRPRLELVGTMRQWAAHPHPVVSGTALAALGHCGHLDSQYIASALGGELNPLVAEILLRAVGQLTAGSVSSWLPVVERWIYSEDPRLAWHAVRAATLHGSDVALWVLRREGEATAAPFACRLGSHAAELLVLAGEAQDASLLAKWVQSETMTPAWLKNIALFGNIQVFEFLLRYLGDEDLSEDAADALEILLGPLVEPLERDSPGAWRRAVATLKFDPAKRYRLGKCWGPERLREEFSLGQLSTLDMEFRLAEFQLRLGRAFVDSQQRWCKDYYVHVQQLVQSIPPLSEVHQGTWLKSK